MDLLTIEQVAQKLALSTKQVRRIVGAGDLPHVRVGHRVRVQESDLVTFIAERKRRGTEDTSTEV